MKDEIQPYAKQVEELSKTMALSAYEPEVSLAVRISKLGAKTTSPVISNTSNVNSEDENMDIDTILMSFGFEYVDATRVTSRVRSESDSPDGKLFAFSFRVSIECKTHYSRPLRCSKPSTRA